MQQWSIIIQSIWKNPSIFKHGQIILQHATKNIQTSSRHVHIYIYIYVHICIYICTSTHHSLSPRHLHPTFLPNRCRPISESPGSSGSIRPSISFFNFSSQNHPQKKGNDKTRRCVAGRLINESKTANTMVVFSFSCLLGSLRMNLWYFMSCFQKKEPKLHSSMARHETVPAGGKARLWWRHMVQTVQIPSCSIRDIAITNLNIHIHTSTFLVFFIFFFAHVVILHLLLVYTKKRRSGENPHSLWKIFGRLPTDPNHHQFTIINPWMDRGWTTHLKNMRKSNWKFPPPPGLGWKFKKYVKPPRNIFWTNPSWICHGWHPSLDSPLWIDFLFSKKNFEDMFKVVKTRRFVCFKTVGTSSMTSWRFSSKNDRMSHKCTCQWLKMINCSISLVPWWLFVDL